MINKYTKYITNETAKDLKYIFQFHPPLEEAYEENGLSCTILEVKYNDGIAKTKDKKVAKPAIPTFNVSYPPAISFKLCVPASKPTTTVSKKINVK